MGRLLQKAVVVFGDIEGNGGTAARMFAREGARIVVCDRLEEIGQGLSNDFWGAYSIIRFLDVDTASSLDMRQAYIDAIKILGKIDVIYNCVSGSGLADGLIENVDDGEFWRSIKDTLYSTWLSCKYGIPELIKYGGGSVINMSSAAAVRGQNGVSAYSAAKGGISSLTRALAKGYARHGVRVNAIAPGAMNTPRIRSMLEESEIIRNNVLGVQQLGLVDSAEVAALATHLASDESRHITGQILSIDGGLTV